MPEIRLEQVRRNFDGFHAVAGLDLTIRDGEFLCLLGPSGCGKTTTLRMIAGLEHLSAGRLSVDGHVVDAPAQAIFVPPERRGMGLVLQSYALWPHLTVEQNIAFGLRLRRIGREGRDRRVTEVMETLGIAAERRRYPSQLSGGQQQRVALARMLVVNPRVLLLDEPLSNLDARLRLEMQAELKRIHREFHTTIVFVTHDQWEAMTLADTIAVMRKGELQQLGSPDEIYARPANRFVAEFVGNPPINMIDLAEPDGTATALRRYLAARHPNLTSVGSVGIRPETIELLPQPPDGAFSAQATVASILPTGGSWIVELRASDKPLFLTLNTPPQIARGDEIRFGVSDRALNIFDREGKRLAV